MLQGERIQEAERILDQVWEEMQRGYIDDTTTFLQTAVYCQVDINRIVSIGNKYLEADVRKEGGATIFNKENAYSEEPIHRYVKAIDNGCKMLRCPECKCQIQAYPFSCAVGSKGYSFCPYCGSDMKKGGTES